MILEFTLWIHISKYSWSLVFPKLLHDNLEFNIVIKEDILIKIAISKSKACYFLLPIYKIKSLIVFIDKQIARVIQL